MDENINLFVVDDDDINNFIIKRLVTKTPYAVNVKTCSSGMEILEYFSEMQHNLSPTLPDVLLVDINMPVITGWDLLDEFEKIPGLPIDKMHIYMVSSSVYQQDIVKASKYKTVRGFISKPLNIDKLTELFRESLNFRQEIL